MIVGYLVKSTSRATALGANAKVPTYCESANPISVVIGILLLLNVAPVWD